MPQKKTVKIVNTSVPPRQRARTGTAGIGQTGGVKTISKTSTLPSQKPTYLKKGMKGYEESLKARTKKAADPKEIRKMRQEEARERGIQNKGTTQSTSKLMSKSGTKNEKLQKQGEKTKSSYKTIRNVTKKQGSKAAEGDRKKFVVQRKKS